MRAALDAAAMGWFVFPVRPGGKVPAVRDWENTATTDPDLIRRWWEPRPHNVGVCAGRSGLLVVDLDPARGHPPPPGWPGARDGLDVLHRLAAAAGKPAPTDTYTVSTPSGGHHLYFRAPAGAQLRNTAGQLGWRIDTRGHGGYVLAAGSAGPEGRYRCTRPGPVAALPAWLLTALTPPPPAAPQVSPGRPVPGAPRAYLRAVVDGECAAVTAATVGHRHSTLLRAARRLGHWVGAEALTEADARTALTHAARHYVGVAGYTAAKLDRDISDGIAYGARLPRHLGDDQHSP